MKKYWLGDLVSFDDDAAMSWWLNEKGEFVVNLWNSATLSEKELTIAKPMFVCGLNYELSHEETFSLSRESRGVLSLAYSIRARLAYPVRASDQSFMPKAKLDDVFVKKLIHDAELRTSLLSRVHDDDDDEHVNPDIVRTSVTYIAEPRSRDLNDLDLKLATKNAIIQRRKQSCSVCSVQVIPSLWNIQRARWNRSSADFCVTMIRAQASP